MNEIIRIIDEKPLLDKNMVNDLIQVEKTLKELKKIEETYKKSIKEAMEKLNIVKITDEITGLVINYIPAQKYLEKFHKEELQEERPDIYDQYVTMDGVRASYITIKTK